MKINLVVCINNKNALGKNNELLYHIPSDLANFKRLTNGGVLIMGKNTYESLPKKPLPNRKTIIICDEEDYIPQASEEVLVIDSIDNAMQLAETLGNENVFVVGGASIYRQFMELGLVDKMYVTRVNDDIEGDVVFPEISEDNWIVRYLSDNMTFENLTYNFIIYEKKI